MVADRPVRLLSLVLVIDVTGDAAGGRSGKRMMTRHVADNAPGDRASDAALGVGRAG